MPVNTMVNYVNNVLSSCKLHIQSHGLGLYFDENGKSVCQFFVK